MRQYTHHVPPPCDKEVGQVFVDNDVIVVNKPEGLLSVPGRFVKDCVLHRICEEFADAVVVHRLDLDTSGLLVFARNKPALASLAKQFRERTIEKDYVAVVYGTLSEDCGSINKAIAQDWSNRPRQIIAPFHGKSALTYFEVTGREPKLNRSRLLLKPETGRSHQLRIHLSSIGHPILGCDLYAHEAALRMSDRLLLHATRLGFDHPVTGEPLQFESRPEF